MEINFIKPYLGHEIWGSNSLGLTEVLKVDTVKQFLRSYPYTYKLALYPLSWLNKEIEYKGQKFVPAQCLGIIITTDHYNGNLFDYFVEEMRIKERSNCRNDIFKSVLARLDKLHEWGFDTGGLIECGYANDRTKDPATPNLYNTMFD